MLCIMPSSSTNCSIILRLSLAILFLVTISLQRDFTTDLLTLDDSDSHSSSVEELFPFVGISTDSPFKMIALSSTTEESKSAAVTPSEKFISKAGDTNDTNSTTEHHITPVDTNNTTILHTSSGDMSQTSSPNAMHTSISTASPLTIANKNISVIEPEKEELPQREYPDYSQLENINELTSTGNNRKPPIRDTASEAPSDENGIADVAEKDKNKTSNIILITILFAAGGVAVLAALMAAVHSKGKKKKNRSQTGKVPSEKGGKTVKEETTNAVSPQIERLKRAANQSNKQRKVTGPLKVKQETSNYSLKRPGGTTKSPGSTLSGSEERILCVSSVKGLEQCTIDLQTQEIEHRTIPDDQSAFLSWLAFRKLLSRHNDGTGSHSMVKNQNNSPSQHTNSKLLMGHPNQTIIVSENGKGSRGRLTSNATLKGITIDQQSIETMYPYKGAGSHTSMASRKSGFNDVGSHISMISKKSGFTEAGSHMTMASKQSGLTEAGSHISMVSKKSGFTDAGSHTSMASKKSGIMDAGSHVTIASRQSDAVKDAGSRISLASGKAEALNDAGSHSSLASRRIETSKATGSRTSLALGKADHASHAGSFKSISLMSEEATAIPLLIIEDEDSSA